MDENLFARLLEYIEKRVPELKGCVEPNRQPPTAGQDGKPYCTFSTDGIDRVRAYDGPSGLTRWEFTLEFWSQDPQLNARYAQKVAGTRADRGLDGFQDVWVADPNSTLTKPIQVTSCRLIDTITRAQRDGAGKETGWHLTLCDFRLFYIEG
jgi:hypothetical protein